MSGSVNKVILVGNLGRDPEIRSLNSGDRVANLSIATSETWRDRTSGERKERTEWHRVVIFNDNLVKVAENYLRKGSKVYIEGALSTRKFTGPVGRREVHAPRWCCRSSAASSPCSTARARAAAAAMKATSAATPAARKQSTGPKETFSADLDDEIPF